MKFSEIKISDYFKHPEYPHLTFVRIEPVKDGRHTYNVENTLPGDEELYQCDDYEEVVRLWKNGDKVVVRGLDLAFVFDRYIEDDKAQIFIEGQSRESGKPYSIIFVKNEVLLPNNGEIMRKEGW